MPKYEIKADKFAHVAPTKPGEPLQVKDYVKGDKIELDAERGKELIKAGALVDPDAPKDGDGKPGQSKAPGGGRRARKTAQSSGSSGSGSSGSGSGSDPQGSGSGSGSGSE